MIARLTLVAVVALVVAYAPQPVAAEQPSWRAVDVGHLPGGGYPYATDVNDRGQVVGASDTTGAVEHAFLWNHGVMVDLWESPGTGWSTQWSMATAVNNRGDVVGAGLRADEPIHGFLWRDGTVIDLTGLNWAYDINDLGQIVGQGGSSAVLWEDGVVTDLGVPGTTSEARAINNRGQVVGWWTDSYSSCHAFLWEDGVVTDLGSIAGDYAVAYDINDRGQVVGMSSTTGPDRHAFLWNAGAMVDLWEDEAGWSSALGINDRGQIVGMGVVAQAGGAFEWEQGTITYLEAGMARRINERGQIAGSSDPFIATLWTRNPAVP